MEEVDGAVLMKINAAILVAKNLPLDLTVGEDEVVAVVMVEGMIAKMVCKDVDVRSLLSPLFCFFLIF